MSAVRPEPASSGADGAVDLDPASLAFEVVWKWSALGAAIRLGHADPVPTHALIDLRVKVLLRPSPVGREPYRSSRRLHGGVVGVAVLEVAGDPGLGIETRLGVRRWALHGSVLATADYLHCDLADEVGPWLRLSLPHERPHERPHDRPSEGALPRYLWSRLPAELGIAGGTCDRVQVARRGPGLDHSASDGAFAGIVSGG